MIGVNFFRIPLVVPVARREFRAEMVRTGAMGYQAVTDEMARKERGAW
mgnify:CR=1 FL=1